MFDLYGEWMEYRNSPEKLIGFAESFELIAKWLREHAANGNRGRELDETFLEYSKLGPK